MANLPTNIEVRMYNVGFGDCFLLTFTYRDDSTRHMLMDCGSTKQASNITLAEVVDDIKGRVEGLLDVLVVTHRHADHLSSFGNATTGTVLSSLKPRVVIRPCVDQPDL